MIAKLKITCPDMAVRNVSKGVSMTDELSCPSTLTFDDGTPPWAGTIIFPKTPVKEQNDLFHWMVDPCIAVNKLSSYNKATKITLNVPEEPCEIKLNFWPYDSQFPFVYMLAHEVVGNITAMLPDGRTGVGKVILPDAIAQWSPQEGLQTWVVGSVVCEGTLTLPDKVLPTWIDAIFDFFKV